MSAHRHGCTFGPGYFRIVLADGTRVRSAGWRAVSLDPGRSYELMPADYALRAVALDRGHHRLRLEYAPEGLRAAAMVSAIAWAAWVGAAVVFLRRLRSNPSTA